MKMQEEFPQATTLLGYEEIGHLHKILNLIISYLKYYIYHNKHFEQNNIGFYQFLPNIKWIKQTVYNFDQNGNTEYIFLKRGLLIKTTQSHVYAVTSGVEQLTSHVA